MVKRLQAAPEKFTPEQLRKFAEYHPAFKLQNEGNNAGTVLVPLAGSVIIPPKGSAPNNEYKYLMHEVLRDFKDEFPPIPKLTADSPSSRWLKFHLNRFDLFINMMFIA